MSRDDALREHVLNSLRRTTGDRFEDAMRDFPVEALNTPAPNVGYTPWHLLEHLRISQQDILAYIRDPHYTSPHWPNEYWPPASAQADAADWNRSLDGFRADRQALEAVVADPGTDLLAPLPDTPGHTLLREALLVIAHSSFHLGEFGILRQVMRTWPAGHQ